MGTRCLVKNFQLIFHWQGINARGGTLNVEARRKSFWKTLNNTQILISNLYKIPKLQFLGLFWGLFWEKWLPFPKQFPEDPLKNQNHNFIPQKYNEHTYHFTMEVPPSSPRGKCHVAICRQWKFKSDPCTRKRKLQKRLAKDFYWIGVQENIGTFSE